MHKPTPEQNFRTDAFLGGVYRIYDSSQKLHKYVYEGKTPAYNIASDWLRLGNDLRKALNYYGEKGKSSTK